MYMYVYMTGFAKTVPNGTRTEIQFIAWHECCTPALSTHTKHTAIDGQVGFHRWLFANPVKLWRCIMGLWSQWTVLMRTCVVPYYCQQLSLFILWTVSVSVTYWRHTTTACRLMEGITHLLLPTLPYHPPPHMCHSWYYSGCEKSCSECSSVS